jgi:hypothetical protein
MPSLPRQGWSAGRASRIEGVLARHIDEWYHSAMRPRREQAPVAIKSDFVSERLKVLTEGGKSQAAVLEELIAKAAPLGKTIHERDNQVFQRALEIAERSSKLQQRFKSMAEFDAHEYDSFGSPR